MSYPCSWQSSDSKFSFSWQFVYLRRRSVPITICDSTNYFIFVTTMVVTLLNARIQYPALAKLIKLYQCYQKFTSFYFLTYCGNNGLFRDSSISTATVWRVSCETLVRIITFCNWSSQTPTMLMIHVLLVSNPMDVISNSSDDMTTQSWFVAEP